MRIGKDDAGLGFNLWTVQGTWFWSLVYPDRHGGAIGAAATEAEAVDEARKTIELALAGCGKRVPHPTFPLCNLPQRGRTNGRKPVLSQGAERFFIRNRLFRTLPEHRADQGVALRRWNEPRPAPVFSTIGESYGNIWQRLLRQYAARVAAA